MFLRSIHVVACNSTSFLFIAEKYFTVLIYKWPLTTRVGTTWVTCMLTFSINISLNNFAVGWIRGCWPSDVEVDYGTWASLDSGIQHRSWNQALWIARDDCTWVFNLREGGVSAPNPLKLKGRILFIHSSVHGHLKCFPLGGSLGFMITKFKYSVTHLTVNPLPFP